MVALRYACVFFVWGVGGGLCMVVWNPRTVSADIFVTVETSLMDKRVLVFMRWWHIVCMPMPDAICRRMRSMVMCLRSCCTFWLYDRRNAIVVSLHRSTAECHNCHSILYFPPRVCVPCTSLSSPPPPLNTTDRTVPGFTKDPSDRRGPGLESSKQLTTRPPKQSEVVTQGRWCVHHPGGGGGLV